MKPKNFLQRVLDYALSELERRARTPEIIERMDVRPRDMPAGEESASELEPAVHEPAVQEPVIEPAVQEPVIEPAAQEPVIEPAPRANGEPRLRREPAPQPAPVVRGLEAVRSQSGDGMILRWSIQAADVARARRLVSGKPVLCLRIVSFTRARDDVRREVQDRPGVDLSGECQVAESPERAVVALGLRAGERFISIAHHVI